MLRTGIAFLFNEWLTNQAFVGILGMSTFHKNDLITVESQNVPTYPPVVLKTSLYCTQKSLHTDQFDLINGCQNKIKMYFDSITLL